MKKAMNTAQKLKFSIKDFFRKLQIWSRLLKKSLMENFIFCAVKVSLMINFREIFFSKFDVTRAI